MDPIAPEVPVCPACHAPVSASANFCLNCGAKLKEPPFTISVGKQIFIYCISFFLAPFGLGYAFKYLRISDPKAKRVGWTVLALTVAAIALMIILTTLFTQWEYSSLNNLY